MAFVETATGRLHFEVCDALAPWISDEQTIIFHHGIAANIHIWAQWLPILALRYRTVRFDMRGFGESVQPDRDFHWSFDVLADDVLQIADACGAKRFHLVGESIGGTAAIATALKAPQRVQSLVLSNAAARGGRVGNVNGWRDLVASQGQPVWAQQMMRSRFFAGALGCEAYAWFLRVHETCSMQSTLALAELLLKSDFTPRLGELRVPALLLSPDASPFIAADVMMEMRGLIKDAELQVFAHAKHGLPLSHGEECARAVRDFLERNFGKGATIDSND